jgi:hypothetical protein
MEHERGAFKVNLPASAISRRIGYSKACDFDVALLSQSVAGYLAKPADLLEKRADCHFGIHF